MDYNAILKRHKPKGWRLYQSGHRTKMALEMRDIYAANKKPKVNADLAEINRNNRTIRAPFVVDEFTLHCNLHEFAHVALGHFNRGESSYHQEEFEADRQAADWMRLAGVPVTRAIRNASKSYLRHCIEADELKGIRIAPHIKRKVK